MIFGPDPAGVFVSGTFASVVSVVRRKREAEVKPLINTLLN